LIIFSAFLKVAHLFNPSLQKYFSVYFRIFRKKKQLVEAIRKCYTA
jgi:hypothetical protein